MPTLPVTARWVRTFVQHFFYTHRSLLSLSVAHASIWDSAPLLRLWQRDVPLFAFVHAHALRYAAFHAAPPL